MQNLDLDKIRINMSDSMVCSFGDVLDAKSIYANNVLETSLTWLSTNLSYMKDTLLSKEEIKQALVDFLWKNVPKPSPNSWLDTVTFHLLFNWALKSIVNLIVNKIFSLIFVDGRLEVVSGYCKEQKLEALVEPKIEVKIDDEPLKRRKRKNKS